MDARDYDYAAEYKLALVEFTAEAEALLLELARKNAPKKTGEFAKSLKPVVTVLGETITLDIISDSTKPEAIWVTEGTRPHTINTIQAKALAFQAKGGSDIIFSNSVSHPGTRPNDFVEKTVAEAYPLILKLLSDKIGKYI